MERATRKRPAELDVPPPPDCLHLVLPVFRQLCPRRDYAGSNPLLLKNTEILAFCRLHGFRLTPLDLELLDTLDVAWVKAMKRADDNPGVIGL